ncbi:MAG TPA: hypothetical protein VLH75_06365 [Longimicrobiales bacterium]|nr:hypothetical protein [Longimicrobiales bacterium]
MPHRVTAGFLTLLALAAGLTQVVWFLAGGAAPATAAPGYVARQIGYGLFVLAAAGLGALILIKGAPRRELSLVAVVLALMGAPFLDSGAGPALAAAGVPAWLFEQALSLGFFMAMAATYAVSRSFPYPLQDGRVARAAPWTAALVAWGLGAAGVLPLTPRVGMAVALGVAAASLFNEGTMYRAADAQGRRRVLWLAQGMVAFTVVAALQVALVVLTRVTPLRIPLAGWEYWLRLAALVAGLAFLGVAVFYRGALDPALVLRRTAVYGIVGVGLVFVFTAVEDLTSSWLTERLGLDESAGSWLAGTVIALIVGSLHDALGRRVKSANARGGS